MLKCECPPVTVIRILGRELQLHSSTGPSQSSLKIKILTWSSNTEGVIHHLLAEDHGFREGGADSQLGPGVR